jgi:hypothetical protein
MTGRRRGVADEGVLTCDHQLLHRGGGSSLNFKKSATLERAATL